MATRRHRRLQRRRSNDALLIRDDGFLQIDTVVGDQVTGSHALGQLEAGWQIVGTGDINGDGTTDILLRHADGGYQAELIENNAVVATVDLEEADDEPQAGDDPAPTDDTPPTDGDTDPSDTPTIRRAAGAADRSRRRPPIPSSSTTACCRRPSSTISSTRRSPAGPAPAFRPSSSRRCTT